LAVEVGFDGLEIRHASRDDAGFISVLRNSKFSLTSLFSCFCNWIRLTEDVRPIGGGRPVLTGAVGSPGEASLAESVSMLHVRSGSKKFRMATSLWGVSTAADTAVGTAVWQRSSVFQTGLLGCSPSTQPLIRVERLCTCHIGH
jgi:hypothetical protein